MVKVEFTLEELNIISDLLTNRISQSPSNISDLIELDLKITNAATEQIDGCDENSCCGGSCHKDEVIGCEEFCGLEECQKHGCINSI